MINLELYKIFVMVSNEENITRASEKLNLTQPAVTKHIKNLERLIGLKLFMRSNHGIKLTKSGRDLYNEIKDSTNLLINIENKYLKVRDINLGIHSTILNNLFSECISQYYITNSKSKINTINDENEQMLLELKNGNIDIIFSKKIDSKYKYKDITFIKIGEWNDVLVSKKDYNSDNKRLTLEDLKKCTIYMPKKTSETPANFFKSLYCNYDDFRDIKHATYKTIIEIVKNNDGERFS